LHKAKGVPFSKTAILLIFFQGLLNSAGRAAQLIINKFIMIEK